MAFIKDDIEEVDCSELLDVISDLVIARNDHIDTSASLPDNFGPLGGIALIDSNADARKVLLDLCFPIVGDCGGTDD